jgi:hypothetical protein
MNGGGKVVQVFGIPPCGGGITLCNHMYKKTGAGSKPELSKDNNLLGLKQTIFSELVGNRSIKIATKV